MATKRSNVAKANAGTSKANAGKGKGTAVMKNVDFEALKASLDELNATLALLGATINAAPAKIEPKAPVKGTKKAAAKAQPSEAQLAARKAWGEKQKAKSARIASFNSPEYKALWTEWKTVNAAVYEACKGDRARIKEQNHSGHLWVMSKLNGEAEKPAKKSRKKSA